MFGCCKLPFFFPLVIHPTTEMTVKSVVKENLVPYNIHVAIDLSYISLSLADMKNVTDYRKKHVFDDP